MVGWWELVGNLYLEICGGVLCAVSCIGYWLFRLVAAISVRSSSSCLCSACSETRRVSHAVRGSSSRRVALSSARPDVDSHCNMFWEGSNKLTRILERKPQTNKSDDFRFFLLPEAVRNFIVYVGIWSYVVLWNSHLNVWSCFSFSTVRTRVGLFPSEGIDCFPRKLLWEPLSLSDSIRLFWQRIWEINIKFGCFFSWGVIGDSKWKTIATRILQHEAMTTRGNFVEHELIIFLLRAPSGTQSMICRMPPTTSPMLSWALLRLINIVVYLSQHQIRGKNKNRHTSYEKKAVLSILFCYLVKSCLFVSLSIAPQLSSCHL